jgi:hypothetical protein
LCARRAEEGTMIDGRSTRQRRRIPWGLLMVEAAILVLAIAVGWLVSSMS